MDRAWEHPIDAPEPYRVGWRHPERLMVQGRRKSLPLPRKFRESGNQLDLAERRVAGNGQAMMIKNNLVRDPAGGGTNQERPFQEGSRIGIALRDEALRAKQLDKDRVVGGRRRLPS